MGYIRFVYMLDESAIRPQWLDPSSPTGLSKDGIEYLTGRNGEHPNVPRPFQVPGLSIRRVDDDGKPVPREDAETVAQEKEQATASALAGISDKEPPSATLPGDDEEPADDLTVKANTGKPVKA